MQERVFGLDEVRAVSVNQVASGDGERSVVIPAVWSLVNPG